MLGDGQTDTYTDRQTDRNTPLPYRGRVTKRKNKCRLHYVVVKNEPHIPGGI